MFSPRTVCVASRSSPVCIRRYEGAKPVVTVVGNYSQLFTRHLQMVTFADKPLRVEECCIRSLNAAAHFISIRFNKRPDKNVSDRNQWPPSACAVSKSHKDLSVMVRQTHFGKIVALLGLAMCPGAVQAANVLALTGGTGIALTCGPSGPGASANIVVKPVTPLVSPATIVVSLVTPLPAGLSVTAPATQTLSTTNQAAGITYVVNTAGGCSGVLPGSNTFSLGFKAGTATDVAATGTTAATPFAVTPSAYRSLLHRWSRTLRDLGAADHLRDVGGC